MTPGRSSPREVSWPPSRQIADGAERRPWPCLCVAGRAGERAEPAALHTGVGEVDVPGAPALPPCRPRVAPPPTHRDGDGALRAECEGGRG